MSDSTIEHSKGYGVRVDTASPTFTGCVVQNNATNGFYLASCDGEINGGSILNNGGYGIYLSSSDTEITQNMISGNGISGIGINNSSPEVNRNDIHDNTSNGIYITGITATPDIFQNRIYNNDTGILCDGSANPLVGGSLINANFIYDNTSFGLNNLSTTVRVEATYNWWGDDSGPYHLTENPSGEGNPVKDNVNISQFISLSIMKGDLNNDGNVDLVDAVLGLHVLIGMNPPGLNPDYIIWAIDVNGDNKIGSDEILYIFQKATATR